jgi:hypothetical protein
MAWIVARGLLRVTRRRWVRSEQAQVMAGKRPQGKSWPFVLMGVFLGFILLLIVTARFENTSLLEMRLRESSSLVLLCIAAGIALELPARHLLPAPRDQILIANVLRFVMARARSAPGNGLTALMKVGTSRMSCSSVVRRAQEPGRRGPVQRSEMRNPTIPPTEPPVGPRPCPVPGFD